MVWIASALSAFSPSVTHASHGENPTFSAGSDYNIRSADGHRLCGVTRGTPLVPDRLSAEGDMVRVQVNSPGCPKQGWISVNGLRSKTAQVDSEGGLALRESADGKFSCNLPGGTHVQVGESMPRGSQYRAWVKVALPEAPTGCPQEGWVHSEYLTPESSFLKNLPKEASHVDDEENEADAPQLCSGPGCKKSSALKDLAKGMKLPFDISSWSKSRGLVQFPTRGSSARDAFCGSFHYNPDLASKGRAVDNYVNPHTACALMTLAQKWKKDVCPDNDNGCRLAWGDISHKTRPKFNGHKTHTNGECIDFRPFRKGGFKDSPLTYGSKGYDRNLTRKFINLVKSMGGQPIYFNDPKISCGRAGGHHNHIHVCFPAKSAKVRNFCHSYQYDAETCES